MGLDISYYSRLKYLRPYEEDYDWDNGETSISINPAFVDRADGLKEGIYDTTQGEGGGFRAGSYSGYNQWRNDLAGLLGKTAEEIWEANQAPAFFELIHFSDCEGVIGPKTSAKLAADFQNYQERAEAYSLTLGDGGYWLQKYNQWRTAFETAADDGAVDFH